MTVLATLLAPDSFYPLGEFLAGYPDVTVELERFVPVGGSAHYLWLGGAGCHALVDDLSDEPSVREVVLVDELLDRLLVRVDWDGVESPLFLLSGDVDATVTAVRWTGDRWEVSLQFPDQVALATFHDRAGAVDTLLELQETHELEAVTDDTGYGLTDTQRETLDVAFEAGYFEVPRHVTLTELADRLGVSEQAVSERLRRGLSSLLITTAFDADAEKFPNGDGSN